MLSGRGVSHVVEEFENSTKVSISLCTTDTFSNPFKETTHYLLVLDTSDIVDQSVADAV